MLPSKLKFVYCHNSSEISSNLLLKVEVYYFKVTSILERVCDAGGGLVASRQALTGVAPGIGLCALETRHMLLESVNLFKNTTSE